VASSQDAGARDGPAAVFRTRENLSS
jgi:hypothetical protein